MLIEQTRRDFIKKTFGAALNAATGGISKNPLKRVGELLKLPKADQTPFYYTFNVEPIIGNFVSFLKGNSIDYNPSTDKFIQHVKRYTGLDGNDAFSYAREFTSNLLNGRGSVDLTLLQQILPLDKKNQKVIIEQLSDLGSAADHIGDQIFDEVELHLHEMGFEDLDISIIDEIVENVYTENTEHIDNIVRTIYNRIGLDDFGERVIDWNKALKWTRDCNINFGNKVILNHNVLGQTSTFNFNKGGHLGDITLAVAKSPGITRSINKITKEVLAKNGISYGKDDINYSRFDYAGGSEDDGYKLALDSFKTDQEKLSLVYEKLVTSA